MPRATCTRSSPPSASPRGPRLAGCALSVVALALCPAPARATGGDDADTDHYSFFAPEIIGHPAEAPLFFGGRAYDARINIAPPTEALEAANLKEWSAYLRGKVPDAQLDALVYRMPLPELERLIWAVEGKPQKLGKDTAALKASLDAVGDKGQVLRALYYLGFAKRCEPITTRRLFEGAWDDAKVAAASARAGELADKLLAGIDGLLAAAKDPFLQERYRFQRMRLLFYTRRLDEAKAYYAANAAAFKTESSVKYRFLSAAAGAFRRADDHGQANYLYSLVFDRYPPLKAVAFGSFRPQEDADWRRSLSLAKTTRERTVLWQLLGVAADGPAAIGQIYALAPASDLLPLLLVREVNQAEWDWWENLNKRRDQVGTGAKEARSDAEAVGRRRLALVKRIAEEKKALDPVLWQLALGHLCAMSGDLKGAAAALDAAERSQPKGAEILAQLRMTRLFARLRGQRGIDKAQEPYLAAELSWLGAQKDPHAEALQTWALGVLRGIYAKGGDPLRALLLVDDSDADLYRDNRRIDELAAWKARPGQSAFDQFLSANHRYTREQLLQLKGNNDLYAGRFQSAVDLLTGAGAALAKEPLPADPFVTHINDCITCDQEAKRAVSYTQLSFARKLLALSREAEGTGAPAAAASFALATGLYNVSRYGNARGSYRTAHDNRPAEGNMDVVERYYKRAMELPGDRELKARACFMAAKAEQNRYYGTLPEGPREGSGVTDAVHSPVYFKRLKGTFADTRYYKEIIRECGYFRSYLGRR